VAFTHTKSLSSRVNSDLRAPSLITISLDDPEVIGLVAYESKDKSPNCRDSLRQGLPLEHFWSIVHVVPGCRKAYTSMLLKVSTISNYFLRERNHRRLPYEVGVADESGR